MRRRAGAYGRRWLAGACVLATLSLGLVHCRRAVPGLRDDRVTIRLAHWQLETGARQAFDEIAAAYMKLHPEVEVVQLAIPERVYRTWMVTQLAGGTAPDLVEILLDAGTSEDRIARNFVPLSDLANAPNPYDRGTDLEGLPLRETFLDGMKGGYFENLLDYYAVPISCPTVRMYYNVDLLRKITGGTTLPRNYAEFTALCRRTTAYARAHHLALAPIAGSRANGLALMIALFDSQTQRLATQLAPPGVIYDNAAAGSIRHAAEYLRGAWSLDSPAIRSGFGLMREVSGEMQPGFMQSERDEAARRFANGQALMINTGSWDAWSLRQQVDFAVAAGPLPFPAVDDPDYGAFTLGPPSEAGIPATGRFGLTRDSRHPEVAKDFLRFLASRQANQLWTNASGWPPAIAGTRVGEAIAPFLPVRQGYVAGFPPNLSLVGFREVSRTLDVNWHRLVGPDGSADAFVAAVQPQYEAALRSDLGRIEQEMRRQARRRDSQFAALAWLARESPGDPAMARRLDRFLQAELSAERRYYQLKSADAAQETARGSP